MAVVIGSERNIKVTAEDNSTSSKSPTFVCSPDDQVRTGLLLSKLPVKALAVQVLFEITAAGSTLIVLRYLDVHRKYKKDILRFYVLS